MSPIFDWRHWSRTPEGFLHAVGHSTVVKRALMAGIRASGTKRTVRAGSDLLRSGVGWQGVFNELSLCRDASDLAGQVGRTEGTTGLRGASEKLDARMVVNANHHQLLGNVGNRRAV